MELLNVLLSSIGSIVALFIITKIIGNKQVSQLSLFDYINGITIGSIAAEMATSLEDDFLKPLLAMTIYAGISILISLLSCKSVKLRRILQGSSLILYQNKKLYKKNLKHAKLDISEFLIQCRNSGYFDISNIDTAVFEPNGKISFIPKSNQKPASPSDLNITVPQEGLVMNVILDGEIMKENLKHTGNNEIWLKKQLDYLGYKQKEVFLATCDLSNNLKVYLRTYEQIKYDPFE